MRWKITLITFFVSGSVLAQCPETGNCYSAFKAAGLFDFTVTPTGTLNQYTFSTARMPNDALITQSCIGKLTSYTWDFGDGTPVVTNQQTVKHTFQSATDCKNAVRQVTLCFEYNEQNNFSQQDSASVVKNVVLSISSNPNYNISVTPQPCGAYQFSYTKTNPTAPTLQSPQWTFGDGFFDSGLSPSHTYNSNGIYTVVLTDAGDPNFCPVVTTVTVTSQPSTDFTFNTTCYSTKVDFQISGYNPSHTYTWDFAGITQTATAATTSYTFGGSGKHVVSLTIKAGSGCSATTYKYVEAGGIPPAFDVQPYFCVGQYLDIKNLAPGGASYTWTLKKGNTTVNPGPGTGMHPIYTLNDPGNFSLQLTVVSPNGCVSASSRTFSVVSVPAISYNVQAAPCGALQALITGPNGYCTIDLGDGKTVTNSTFPYKYTYAAPGTYTVTVTPNAQCAAAVQKTVTIPPVTDVLIHAPVTALCAGASATLQGIVQYPLPLENYTYTWSGPKTGSGPTLSVTQGGVYTLTVKSSGACQQTFTRQVTVVDLADPASGYTVTNLKGVSCPGTADGSAVLLIDASLAAAGYTVNGGAVSYTTSYPVSGLVQGLNYLYLAHAQSPGCYTVITVDVPYAGPALSLSATASKCSGPTGSASVSVSGGSGSFSYQWHHISTPATVWTSPGLSGKAAGVYIVKVTDNNTGCVLSAQVEIPQLALNLSLNKPQPQTCPPANATVSAQVSYNIPQSFSLNLLFTWSVYNGNAWSPLGGANSPSRSLGAGTYRLLVNDVSSGCSAEQVFTVKALDKLSLTFLTTQPRCAGQIGAVLAQVSGGSGVYTYAWSPPGIGNSPLAAPLPAGTAFSLTVTDLAGCALVSSGKLDALSGSPLTYQGVNITPCSLTVSVSGGQAPYLFEWYQERPTTFYGWGPKGFSQVIGQAGTETVLVHQHSGASPNTTTTKPFETGEYTLIITDVNGCSISVTAEIELPDEGPWPFASFDFAWKKVDIIPEEEEQGKADPVIRENMAEAKNELFNAFQDCVQKQQDKFAGEVQDNCFDPTVFFDQLDLSYTFSEDHYTLYYYDRAGQLTKTVPPEGVRLLDDQQISAILDYRKTGVAAATYLPPHVMPTRYRYNSLGQLQEQQTPDGGQTLFLYDQLSRLRFSQSAQQKLDGTFSYTKFDELGRIREVGESSLAAHGYNAFAGLAAQVNAPAFPQNNIREVTRTTYSDPAPVDYSGKPQRFLQNRVSYVCTDEDGDFGTTSDQYCSYYSYDAHGNVEWLIQQDPHIGKNYLAYDYDLISGKVRQVRYNEYRPDRFFHRYTYDPENRIDSVLTSRDGILWENDAAYAYYPHGPLERTRIGEDKVQGLDYVYTIHGWLKSINTPAVDKTKDPGGDGKNNNVAKDIFGMSLGYYQGDFVRTGSFLSDMNGLYQSQVPDSRDLYNGNIAHWAQSQIDADAGAPGNYKTLDARAGLYRYDVLNRLKTSFHHRQNGNNWASLNQNYRTAYTYDANGNIRSLQRHEQSSALMDDLTYEYDYDAQNPVWNNRLKKVTDNSPSASDGRGDLEADHTYDYDADGNLIRDKGQERLNLGGTGFALYDVELLMDWTVYGKVRAVRKTISKGNTPKQKELIRFAYDPAGNRVYKAHFIDADADGVYEEDKSAYTYYVQDAQGNPMAIYSRKNTFKTGNTYEASLSLIEQPLYGADRLGLNVHPVEMGKQDYTAGSTVQFNIPNNGYRVRSEYQNWITSSNRKLQLPGGVAEFCEGRITRINFDQGYASPGDLAQVLGIADNGVAVAEDFDGHLQFYVVLVKDYLGSAEACLLFDKNGFLIQGTELITDVETACKPIVTQFPGSPYYLVFTLNTQQQPVYHVVDMSQKGLGTVFNGGKVIQANIPVETPPAASTTYGLHFTAYEDHIDNRTVVYHTRYTPSLASPEEGTTDVVAYVFSGTYNQSPAVHTLLSIDGCHPTQQGELQIAPDGRQLAFYQHDKNISAFAARQHRLHVLPLNPQKTGLVGSPALIEGHPGGNFGDGSFDFSASAQALLFSQRGVYQDPVTNVERNTWKHETLNPGKLSAINPLNTYLFSEIRRGVDQRYYIPVLDEQSNTIQSYDAAQGTLSPENLFAAANAYDLASSLPTQVYKVAASGAQGEHYRYLGEKQYELKDHLGNVRVVISDAKMNAAGEYTADMSSFTDYYPFGMGMPGRVFEGQGFRFGFQGQELDRYMNESISFRNRMYFPRIGRFISVDPIASDYPELTPYQQASNSPIAHADLEGLEKIYYMGKFAENQEYSSIVTLANKTETMKSGVEEFKKHNRNAVIMDANIGGRGLEITITAAYLLSYYKAQEDKDRSSSYVGRALTQYGIDVNNPEFMAIVKESYELKKDISIILISRTKLKDSNYKIGLKENVFTLIHEFAFHALPKAMGLEWAFDENKAHLHNYAPRDEKGEIIEGETGGTGAGFSPSYESIDEEKNKNSGALKAKKEVEIVVDEN